MRRFRFAHYYELGTPPDDSKLPAMPELDPDSAIAAEVAVERDDGTATPEQEEYIRECRAFQPYQAESTESVEAEFSNEQAAKAKAGQPAAVSYDEAAPPGRTFFNTEDGTVTHVVDARPDPRQED